MESMREAVRGLHKFGLITTKENGDISKARRRCNFFYLSVDLNKENLELSDKIYYVFRGGCSMGEKWSRCNHL